MKNIFILFIISILFYACEKTIEIEQPKLKNKIVVEGYIEQGEHPYVFISKNSSYFEPITKQDLISLMILNAEVSVSDGIFTETLQLIYDSLHFPYYKYVGNTLIGEVGKVYSLEIKIDGKILTSKTTIPNPVLIDSLYFKFDKFSDIDSMSVLWFNFNEPDTLGNYYRIATKVIGEDDIFYTPYSSIADDKLINGIKNIPYSTYRGFDPFKEFTETEDSTKWYFKNNDSVAFKFASIDATTYKYWYSVDMAKNSGGPYSSPIKIQSNIDGGVGIWGGYGISIYTIKNTIK
jgi:hypothetical protein